MDSGGFRGDRTGPGTLLDDGLTAPSLMVLLVCDNDRIYLVKHVNIVLKIFKMIATSGFLAALEHTKFVFGRGSAPDFARGAYSAS